MCVQTRQSPQKNYHRYNHINHQSTRRSTRDWTRNLRHL